MLAMFFETVYYICSWNFSRIIGTINRLRISESVLQLMDCGGLTICYHIKTLASDVINHNHKIGV